MKITQIDAANIKEIRSVVNGILAEYGRQVGLQFSLGTIRYSRGNFRCRLEGNVNDPSVKQQSVTFDFTTTCQMYGIDPKALGNPFTVQGTTYSLTGAKPSRPKYPFVGIGPQGGKYKFTAGQVKSGLDSKFLIK